MNWAKRSRRGTGFGPGEGVAFGPGVADLGDQPAAFTPASSPAPAPIVSLPSQPTVMAQLPRRAAGARAPHFRFACVFGPPCSGITSICQTLAGASRSVTYLDPDFAPLMVQADKLYDPERVLLIDGLPRGPEALQGVWDMRLAAPPRGALVEIYADDDVCIKRGATRESVAAYRKLRVEMEALVAQLGTTILGVNNNGTLDSATLEACIRLGVED